MKLKILLEYLESYIYELPTKKDGSIDLFQLMMDFYLMSYLREIGDEKLDRILIESKIKLYSYLKKHLLETTLFAIASEFSHVRNKLYNYKGDNNKIKEFIDEFINKDNTTRKVLYSSHNNDEKEVRDILSYVPNYNEITNDLVSLSPLITAKILTNNKDWKFVEIAKDVFLNGVWEIDYGGESWAKICDAWLDLNNTEVNEKNLGKLEDYIDRIYDLQHNTNTIFNKIKKYYINGDIDWLKRALDWKFNTKSMYEFFDKCSSSLRRLAGFVLKAMHDTTYEQWLKQNNNKQFIVDELNDEEYLKWLISNFSEDKDRTEIKRLSNGKISIKSNLTLNEKFKFSSIRPIIYSTYKLVLENVPNIVNLQYCPTNVTSLKIINCHKLTNLIGAPQKVEDSLIITDCSNLISLEGFPEYVGGMIMLNNLHNLKSIVGLPSQVGGSLLLYSLRSLTSLEGIPNIIYNNLEIKYLKNLNNLYYLPSVIFGDLKLYRLSIKTLTTNKNITIHGSLYVYDCDYIKSNEGLENYNVKGEIVISSNYYNYKK